MSDTVLDFLMVIVDGGAMVDHPGLRALPPPRWERVEHVFEDPAAARDFARRIVAVCCPLLIQDLVAALGGSRPAETPGEADLVGELVRSMREHFADPALTALGLALADEASKGLPVEAPLTVEDLKAFASADGHVVDATAFHALDMDVEDEIANFVGSQVSVLHKLWQDLSWAPTLASTQMEAFRAWQQGLSVESVAQYCAAAGATVRGTLVDASVPGERAVGRLEGLRSEPTLVVFARPDTVLAKDARLGAAGGDVRITPSQFAHEIAVYAGEGWMAGDFAWRSTGWWLREFGHVLPGLEVKHGDGETAHVFRV